ncbi:MAG TPA: Sec-independent protein translocase protein TatB [Pyrinomonadaceae bacterium]|nr:Sec-independent protein translocase protein TatB [Pyrinomonadaceae bacterium]
MFLFILESIGTSELVLIGIIALIFLGPRKLPQIAKTIGKTMADFRSTTNEFKETWRREVDFEDEINSIRNFDAVDPEPATVPRIDSPAIEKNAFAAPEIKPAQTELFADLPAGTNTETTPETKTEPIPDDDLTDKRNWL